MMLDIQTCWATKLGKTDKRSLSCLSFSFWVLKRISNDRLHSISSTFTCAFFVQNFGAKSYTKLAMGFEILALKISYEKCTQKMLMKLTPGVFFQKKRKYVFLSKTTISNASISIQVFRKPPGAPGRVRVVDSIHLTNLTIHWIVRLVRSD